MKRATIDILSIEETGEDFTFSISVLNLENKTNEEFISYITENAEKLAEDACYNGFDRILDYVGVIGIGMEDIPDDEVEDEVEHSVRL